MRNVNHDISINYDNIYLSKLCSRFSYIKLLRDNTILKNTNNGTNCNTQGKVNFFNVNNNIYCLNTYYFQNFLKLKKGKQTIISKPRKPKILSKGKATKIILIGRIKKKKTFNFIKKIKTKK